MAVSTTATSNISITNSFRCRDVYGTSVPSDLFHSLNIFHRSIPLREIYGTTTGSPAIKIIFKISVITQMITENTCKYYMVG